MIKGASMFSNVGIDEHYFKDCGIDIVLANELLIKRAKFYQHLYPNVEMICGDITEDVILKQYIKKFKELNCNFLLATPPCQGMSVAGKMNENDIRNKLIKWVIEVARKTQPKYIMIENVIGLLKFKINCNGQKNLIKDLIINSFEEMGYFVNFGVFDAADYGTPQIRKRAIFLISKDLKWEFPKKEKQITVRAAIGDLPSLESGQDSGIKYHMAKEHNARHIHFMKHTPTGKSAHNNEVNFPVKESGQRIKGYSTTYKRIEWDKPAPTITMANGSISSQNNVHPGRRMPDGTYSDARVLTILELLRLSGLPDDWNIPDWANESLVRDVLGEAFPPKFACAFIKKLNL